MRIIGGTCCGIEEVRKYVNTKSKFSRISQKDESSEYYIDHDKTMGLLLVDLA